MIKRNKGEPLSDLFIRPYAIVRKPGKLKEWLEEVGFPAINLIKKTGDERFYSGREKHNNTLKNFWQWAFSDLINNTMRGALAEYIVAASLGITDMPRPSWAAFDLDYNGIKIEVKSSAYLQSWFHKEFSKIVFGIPKTLAWDEKIGEFFGEPKRQADIYVFCLLKHRVLATLDPLNMDQWEFYLLPTAVLNDMHDKKSISLKKLESLKATKSTYEKLKENIDRLLK